VDFEGVDERRAVAEPDHSEMLMSMLTAREGTRKEELREINLGTFNSLLDRQFSIIGTAAQGV